MAAAPTQRALPLAGFRVIDFSQIVSGPMAACILADQGADVIKIESPSGDPVRAFGPRKGSMSATYIAVNRGKRDLAIDLKHPDAVAIISRLIADADVLIENFRPGVLARLGFGWDAARAINPRLVYASINGFGPDGPYRNIRVYDPAVQAVSGLAATQIGDTGVPTLIGSLIADKLTALTAAQAITAALLARSRTGLGELVEVSMLDAAIAFNWPDGMYNHSFQDDPPEAMPGYGAAIRLWDAADGQVAVGALQDGEFVALCAAVGCPDLAADPDLATGPGRRVHAERWMPVLGAAIAARDLDTLMAGFIAHGAVGGRVNRLGDVAGDAQVRHNRSVAEIDHGALGRVATARAPARFGGSSVDPRPAPWLGEHSRAVLREIGRSDAEIAALLASGAVFAA